MLGEPMSDSHQHHDHAQHGAATDIDELFSAAFWDERYSSSPAVWSGNPNPQLVAEVADLEAGKALDAGCGEGADAIWLAEHGWQVTAVDVSTVALDRGAAHASELDSQVAARISWQQADLLSWRPTPGCYDLVSVQYMQLPAKLRAGFFGRLAAGVAPGGTLLLVGHSPSDLSTTVRRPPLPELFFTATELADTLDASAWTILACEARPRQVPDPDGDLVTVHDEVVAARRM
jgi:SAM-dependent methyltransferase